MPEALAKQPPGIATARPHRADVTQHSAAPMRPVRVHVLVDLAWRPEAGGHVKCWEAFAHAALEVADQIDLTLHFSRPSGSTHGQKPVPYGPIIEIGPQTRYHLHRPVFSTARLPFLDAAPDHTDLAPYHPGLAKALTGADVIHTTDAFFNFAKTATRVAKRSGIPLVNSIHTDTPVYTRQYTADIIHQLFGKGWISRFLLGTMAVDQRGERSMRRKLARHQAQAAFALLSRPEDMEDALRVLPPERIGFLSRGLDTIQFTPQKRDRTWLYEAYGIPPDAVVLLTVGRIDSIKRTLIIAQAAKILIDQGLPLWLVCAGEGPDRPHIVTMLGQRVLCPGFVPANSIARLEASADIFAMPSKNETFGNAAAEALASGLPILVSEESGMERLLGDGAGGLVVNGGAVEWANALRPLITDRPARIRMAKAARHTAEKSLPSWLEILKRDLLPVWQAAAGQTNITDHNTDQF